MEILRPPKTVKARKSHTCDYCGKVIEIGEEHEVGTYVGDYIYDWRECNRCKPYVSEAFQNKAYDFSEGMGEQDFREYMWEEHRDVALSWWHEN